MPRTARMVLPGVALHVRHRGHNRDRCFFGDGDYARYLGLLGQLSTEHACEVHAYCLMTNHVHLLVTPQSHDSCAQMMKRLAQFYTQHVNKRQERSGSLWEGRFRSCLVMTERYALACYRYVELNPVAAGMVPHPRDYAWSSYHANAEGRLDSIVRPHPAYPGASAYRGLFEDSLDPSLLDELRKATDGGFAAGAIRRKRGRQMRKIGTVPI
ncbi:MAG: transposase [Burkholderiales bacterium]